MRLNARGNPPIRVQMAVVSSDRVTGTKKDSPLI
jgi:hypothetical protein